MRQDWWRHGVIYQVYPRSFADGNGDGVGDLPGITGRLDHLVHLGVDALWLSPVYPSPMADFGYDVADHCDIDPVFGTLADMDRLIAEAHARSIAVIMDFVPNHTSDRHPWFVASRSSRTSPQRDWYVWRDPAPDGGPPNNWLSEFGGPAWEFDAATGQYYLHSYLVEQPDLDWRNPEVERAMHGVLRFWLERGVDGFRLDALSHVLKDRALRDNPPNPRWRPAMGPYKRLLATYSNDLDGIHELLGRLRAVVDAYGERVLIGELYLPFDRLVRYYGQDDEIHLPTNFELLRIPWRADAVVRAIEAYEGALPPFAWPNWVLGNHDKHRVASRVGIAQARVAAMLLLTLRGTPTIYYGDEIGMTDIDVPPHLVQDPWERNVPGLGLGRDPERSPMQWDASPGAGFTTGTPWLPLAPDHAEVNVAAQSADPDSMLALYRRLLALRRREPALMAGAIDLLPLREHVVRYRRMAPGGAAFEVLLNFSASAAHVARTGPQGVVACATRRGREGAPIGADVRLLPGEGIVIRLA